MPSARRAVKKKRRSQTTQNAVPKPPNLGGRIMWLPKLNELKTPSGLPDACHDHPVILLSPNLLPNNEVVVLMVTSFGGRDLKTRHRHNYERWMRAHYLPIDPSPAHPDDPDKNVVLKLGGGAVLRKNSWVNTETQYRVIFSLLRNYDSRSGKLFVLMPESYGKLKDFVGFRDNEIVAGPSGTSEPGATPAVTQTATPPLTPALRPVVVPEPVPEPATQLPEVVEPAMTHDSDSDTTIVAEDYWDADRRRRREQLLNQQSAMQTYRPVPPPNVPVAPSRSSTVQALRQANNERSSLLRSQSQVTAPNPPSKSQVPIPVTRTGYGTVSSSSRPAAASHTPRSHGQVRSQSYEALIRARARAWARARAAAKLKLAILKRKKPRRTWFSQLGFPFRVDFIFFGVASTDVWNRARAHDRAVATARAQMRQGGYESMITEAEVRAIEWEVNAGSAYEYARIAPSDRDGQRGCKGRLSVLARVTLVVVILLVQAILLAAVVWSVVQCEADTAVVEWVARAAGKVVDAWEFLVYCFWWLVDLVVNIVIGLWCLLYVLICLASCCGI
ncbi:hypothetical protein NCU07798 [Neurospora crassa OR74A]|uniref:Uncharacterized protein n=1 Tax=Neurospora crassa (strain ATCC 24698 / 74-OR23-1A / CBS 708.71 / DSM 1257 / FGSC 987) TaxID=367110 RepID=Q7S1D0_NEUCR|nr:hypothetical protein NCU07798 [Neurospora crassa OR74A]EAA29148.2 hypothetical protein NCU07798 [Neurospora crassa OR74A]|eukprot:XP_958384.2 hypothetical protein NCU07798 [Neurospora crassa OR74A]